MSGAESVANQSKTCLTGLSLAKKASQALQEGGECLNQVYQNNSKKDGRFGLYLDINGGYRLRVHGQRAVDFKPDI